MCVWIEGVGERVKKATPPSTNRGNSSIYKRSPQRIALRASQWGGGLGVGRGFAAIQPRPGEGAMPPHKSHYM